MPEPIRTLTLDELAAEASAPSALLERLVQLGQLRRDGEGRFDARDVAIIATVQALEGAGVSDDDLVWLIQNAGGGYQAVGRMFTTPAPRGAPTYREFLASLGPLGSRVAAIYAGFGLPEPEPDRPMRGDGAFRVRRVLLGC